MTNEELFNDLKQFITATVSQQTADIRGDISGIKGDISGIRADIKALDVKIDQVQDGVGDTLIKLTKALDVTKEVQDHEHRITRLEHNLA